MGSSGAFVIPSLKKWCRKSPRPVLQAASHINEVVADGFGGWIGRRRTIQGRKSDAQDENRLVSTRMLGDHHASTVSVVSIIGCPESAGQGEGVKA
ncbi:hypothetical protein PITC_023810 [Penicillium italicum]|uniref:Uncharacterized protein n=1 Tax=Penicillium italicum TaxID=40296 RepID=A0A0A2LB32_PENIT|nr:hypothetical protein PITC_023810 [Penicillium italicum]